MLQIHFLERLCILTYEPHFFRSLANWRNLSNFAIRFLYLAKYIGVKKFE